MASILQRINSNPYLSFSTKYVACLGGCLVLHKGLTLASKYMNRRLRRQTKWYLVHTAGNAVIVALTAKGMLKTFRDPVNAVNDVEDFHALTTLSSWPIVIMSSIHLYHILLYFREMTKIDWIHHLVNSGLVGSICTFYIRGSVVNHGLFFMCGLPGGIDYALLSLNDFGIITRMTEKRINRYLNMYIRLPGILFNSYAGVVAHLYQNLGYNTLLGSLVLALNSWNAIYFAQRVTENYGYQLGRQSAINDSVDTSEQLKYDGRNTGFRLLCSCQEPPSTPGQPYSESKTANNDTIVSEDVTEITDIRLRQSRLLVNSLQDGK